MTQYLDEQLLSELSAVLGEELRDIAGVFVGQLNEQTGDIVACHAQGDLPALAALAHGLKGSAGNMGAVAVSALAGSIEKLAIAEDRSALPPLVIALPALTRHTIAALRASGFVAAE